MDDAVIVCIKSSYYPQAANLILKGLLKDKIHTLGQKERERKTRALAKLIKGKHEHLRSWYADINIKPKEIAEEVYKEIMGELTQESTHHRGLSELGDE